MDKKSSSSGGGSSNQGVVIPADDKKTARKAGYFSGLQRKIIKYNFVGLNLFQFWINPLMSAILFPEGYEFSATATTTACHPSLEVKTLSKSSNILY
ncbi:hypothetical protein QYF36_016805 [Acer negundo]|nr:hypothetical protein QYF36_016805 [Acer negundo]